MTTADACRLLVDAVRELSAARDEAAMYRLVAQMAVHSLHDQGVELARVRERYRALLETQRARPAA